MEKKQKDEILAYYRGEAEDYKNTICKPSIFRVNGYSIQFEQEWYDKLIDSFQQLPIIDRIVNDAKKYEYNYLKVIGVLQHYGFKTRLLDITKNLKIAKYFAACSNFTEQGYVYKFDEETLKAFQTPDAESFVRKIKCIRNAKQWENRNVWNELEFKPKSWKSTLTDNHVVDYETVLKDVIGTTTDNIRLTDQEGAFIFFGIKVDENNRLTSDFNEIKTNNPIDIPANQKFDVLIDLAFAEDTPICHCYLSRDDDQAMKIIAKYEEIHILYHNNKDVAKQQYSEYCTSQFSQSQLLSSIVEDFDIWANNKVGFCFLFKEFLDYFKEMKEVAALEKYHKMKERVKE